LKTCKHLNKFTLDELAAISETDRKLLEPVLKEFVADKKLIFRSGIYFFNNTKPILPRLFQHNSDETIDMTMKCFCADVSVMKVGLILNLNVDCICNFNKFFRKTLYEKQELELCEHFRKQPQIVRCRMFFDTQMHFYFYENKLYVSEEILEASNAKPFTKEQIQEFKKIYSFLARVTSHNKNETNLSHHLAEMIWRRNKPFEQLLPEVKKLINA